MPFEHAASCAQRAAVVNTYDASRKAASGKSWTPSWQHTTSASSGPAGLVTVHTSCTVVAVSIVASVCPSWVMTYTV